ncbi:MAG: amidohydrolase [Clostridia bacterium]|nr:amidohydrolase [Clostridia bacterium]
MLNAIDMHCHFNHGAPHDTKTNELYLCDNDFLKAERKRMGVLAMATSSFSSVLSNQEVYEENEYLYKLAQEDPFIYQWVVVDPRNEKTFEQARYMLKSEKALGLKMHPAYHGYKIMEYADKLFAFANDLGCFLLTHPENEIESSRLADKYPDMKLINAHLGIVEHVIAMENSKYGNVYTDTSGSLSYRNNVLEYAVKRVGSDKIFFGTDTYSCAFQRGRVEFADISSEDKENIFYKNAVRCFPQLQKLFKQ